MALDSELRELLDQQQLRDLVARYCRGVDRRDEELILSCYHPDAYDEHGSFRGSPAEFAARMTRSTKHPGFLQHAITNALFEVKGDVAWGETYVEMRGSDEKDELTTAYGRYIDRFERRNGAWRIALRRVILEWAPADSGRDPADFPPGRRDRTDPSYER